MVFVFLYTTPRHPQSNGPAEKIVRAVKSAVHSANSYSFIDFDRAADNSILQYRILNHCVIGKHPKQLFESRFLRSSFS